MWAHAKPEKFSIFIGAIKLDLDRAEQSHRKLDGWISSIIKIHHGKSIENLYDRSAKHDIVIGDWMMENKSKK